MSENFLRNKIEEVVIEINFVNLDNDSEKTKKYEFIAGENFDERKDETIDDLIHHLLEGRGIEKDEFGDEMSIINFFVTLKFFD